MKQTDVKPNISFVLCLSQNKRNKQGSQITASGKGFPSNYNYFLSMATLVDTCNY